MSLATVSIELASTSPIFGQSGTATITGNSSWGSDTTQVEWTITNPTVYGTDKTTYILAVVLADPTGGVGVDAGDFFAGDSSGYLFLQEPGWDVPDSTPGTAYVAVAKATGNSSNCILDLVGEEPESTTTLNTRIYLYTVGIGMWWVTSTVTIPREAS